MKISKRFTNNQLTSDTMDLYSGWPFYEPRRCWDEPRYGGFRGHPSMSMSRPGYYDEYYDHPWYPETPYSPFHRHNKFSSPFYRRNPTPFEDIFDAHQHPRRARNHMTSASPTERSNDPQVGREQSVDKSVRPTDTVTAQSASVTEEAPEQCTPDAMESQTQQPADNEGPTMDSLPPEINKIADIMKKTVELQEKISAYDGVPATKDYIYIEESLVAVLLQLDKIEANGNVDIRKARKSAVCQVQQMLTDLENKAKSNMAATEIEFTRVEDDKAVVTDDEAVVTDDVSDVEQPSEVTTSEQERTLTVTDPSDTADLPAVEEAACEADVAELAIEQPTIDNVHPSSLTAVTSNTEEESTIAGDEHNDAAENVMDCTSDTSPEDSTVNTT